MNSLNLDKIGQEEAKEYQNASEALKHLLPQLKTSLDRWVTFLGKYELLNPKELVENLKDPLLEKAVDVMEKMELNEMERAVYEDHLKWLWTEAAALEKAEEKGIAKGRAEGETIGKAEEKIFNLLSYLYL